MDTTSSNSLNSISTLYFPGGLCWSFSDYPSSICPRSVRHHADGLCGAGTVCSPTSFYINTQDDTTLEMTPGYFPSFVADTQHDPALEGTLIMLHHIPGISSLNNTLRRREHWLCSVLYVHDHRFNRRGHVSSETLFYCGLTNSPPSFCITNSIQSYQVCDRTRLANHSRAAVVGCVFEPNHCISRWRGLSTTATIASIILCFFRR